MCGSPTSLPATFSRGAPRFSPPAFLPPLIAVSQSPLPAGIPWEPTGHTSQRSRQSDCRPLLLPPLLQIQPPLPHLSSSPHAVALLSSLPPMPANRPGLLGQPSFPFILSIRPATSTGFLWASPKLDPETNKPIEQVGELQIFALLHTQACCLIASSVRQLVGEINPCLIWLKVLSKRWNP